MKQYIILLLICWISSNLLGQGWEKNYSAPGNFSGLSAVQQTLDGGYIATGSFATSSGMPLDVYLVKTDVNGDTLWTRTYGGPNYDVGHSVRQTADGGYIVAGVYAVSNMANGEGYLIKTDANGDTLWTKRYNENSHEQSFYDVYQTDDGGYIAGGTNYTNSTSNLNSYLYLVKTDSVGTVTWKKNHGPGRETRGYSVAPTLGGGYMIAGYTKTLYNPGVSTGTSKDAILIKTDNNGDTLWTSIINEPGGGFSYTQTCYSAQQTQDSGYIFVGEQFDPPFGYNVYLVKTDKYGIPTWRKSHGSLGTGIDKGYGVCSTNDGGYIFVGEIFSTFPRDLYISKTDSLGNELWSKTLSSQGPNYDGGYSVSQTSDNGYIIAGHKDNKAILIKLDSLGHLASNKLLGIIYQDNNNNCSYDTLTDYHLSGVIVQIEDSITGQLSFATTDSNGYYIAEVDTGTYFTSIASAQLYYQNNCQSSIDTTVSNTLYQQDTVNFPLTPLLYCPLLEVDISAPLLRSTGGGTNYTVTYRNSGTQSVNNIYVEVDLDPVLTVLSSSIPIVNQVGDRYTFNLGYLDIGEAGAFNITVIAAPTTPPGQTICAEAHIYPDSICIPNYWNGPHLNVVAQCINDTVYFEVRNKGAAMSVGHNFYVYEDNIMLRTGVTNPLGLNGTQVITQPAAQGKAYRFEVDQDPNFPALLGDSIANITIAGCNPFPSGFFNTGLLTLFSNGSSAPFLAVDCQPLRSSYDPNDKSAQPVGYGNNHYIYDYTALDYKVRFQNTGTDTAFLVVIRDTLSPYFNLASIQMGASSHPYTWRLYGSNVLEVTFSNILLPDSTTNEAASNGFFRFRIEQQVGNPLGSVIYNSAAIYFDYNAPIITNQTFHTIGDNFVVMQLLGTDNILTDDAIEIQVFPNPFKEQTTLKIVGESYKSLELYIYDLTGKLVQQQNSTGDQIILQRQEMQTGLYFYKLKGDGILLNAGKIIAQ